VPAVAYSNSLNRRSFGPVGAPVVSLKLEGKAIKGVIGASKKLP